MISEEKKLRNNRIAKETYINKHLYWEKVKNEISFLQKENNMLDDKMLKKLRRLHKLKAKNLYLASVIQHSLAVKSMLISLNDMLRSPIPDGMTKNSAKASSEDAPAFSTSKMNTLENDLLKEIMNQILLTSSNNCLISSQPKQTVLNSASLTSEASISRLQGGSLGSREQWSQVKD